MRRTQPPARFRIFVRSAPSPFGSYQASDFLCGSLCDVGSASSDGSQGTSPNNVQRNDQEMEFIAGEARGTYFVTLIVHWGQRSRL